MLNEKLVVRHISSPIPAGNLAVLVGDGFSGDDIEVVLTSAEDADKGLPMAKGTEVKSVVSAKIFSIAEGHTITFMVPEGDYKVWTAQVMNCEGKSNTYTFNIPELKWISEDKISPEGEFRIFGQGLVGIDEYPKGTTQKPVSYGGYLENSNASVVIKSKSGKFTQAKIIKSSAYDMFVKMPKEIESGEYEVFVHNGHGGDLGWSKPLVVEVVAQKTWSDKIFNVVDYGAKPAYILDVTAIEAIDNTAPIQAALDMAGQNGGGVVLVPPGRYCFKGGLHIPRYTVLKGEDVNRVWFELPMGVSGEDGWGTAEEGIAINVFITGDGDFGVENINMHSVYTPVVIGAPTVKSIPKLTDDDLYNRYCGYSSLIDANRQADNVFIKNCFIVQEHTYFSQRKHGKDPLLSQEKADGIDAKMHCWAAVAIKGSHTSITGCDIKSGGNPIVLMAAEYIRVAENKLYVGNTSSHITMFSSSYNPYHKWHKPNRYVVIEDNEMYVASNLNRSANWIMEAHTHYYMARNFIGPLFWSADTEGLNFHLWDLHIALGIDRSFEDEIVMNKDEIIRQFNKVPFTHDIFEQTGKMIPNSLKGWECLIIGGKGIGQYRKIKGNTENTITLDKSWDTEPDNTSRIDLSKYSKFHHTLMIDNVANEGGRSFYYWGCSFESVMDGNIARRNSGIIMEDLSNHPNKQRGWDSCGHYFNQIINNKLSQARGFSSNFGVIGVSNGHFPSSTVSMIIRGNVAEDDAVIVAKPRLQSEGLNYLGLVIENNVIRNSQIGILVDENIDVVLKDNKFENVDNQIVGAGNFSKIV